VKAAVSEQTNRCVDRIALGTSAWFPIACAQLSGNAVGRFVPGAPTPFTVELLRRAGVDTGEAAAAFTASTGLQLATAAALPLLALLPFTPGGLGFVEAGLVGTLALAGVPGPKALAATLLYRLVAYWLPIPAGGVAYFLFRRRYH
jgi:hypothetical protein